MGRFWIAPRSFTHAVFDQSQSGDQPKTMMVNRIVNGKPSRSVALLILENPHHYSVVILTDLFRQLGIGTPRPLSFFFRQATFCPFIVYAYEPSSNNYRRKPEKNIYIFVELLL